MNQGAKYTLVIAAVLFGAAVFPLLAVAASLILVGMALHSILGNAPDSPLPRDAARLEQQRTEQLIQEARRRLDHEL